MSLADVLGTPVHDPVAGEGPAGQPCRVPDYTEFDTAPDRSPRNRTWLILGWVVALAAGVAAGWFMSDFARTDPAVGGGVNVLLPADIAAQAELYTALNLSGAKDGNEASDAVWVNHTAAVAGEQIDEHTWQVTVAVDSLELVGTTYQPAGLQYFSVMVSTTGGQPSGSGSPARIPAPAQVRTAESVFSNPVAQDQAATAIGFLGQYLTGGAEVNRYLATPSGIVPFAAAPYQDVNPVPLGANSLGQIRVAVAATKENGITHHLEYVLTLAIADGVWVIEDVSASAG